MSPIFTSVQAKDLLKANSLRSLLLAISFTAASCAIMRSSHCCANWPDNEASCANVGSPSLSSYLQGSAGLDPKTIW